MPTIRVTLNGRRILVNPVSRLGGELWGRYLDTTRDAGATYDRTYGCQATHDSRLKDMLRALSTAGFEVEVDEFIVQKMEAAQATAQADQSEAKDLHDAAIARMNQIDAELALKGLALYDYQRDGVRWLSHRKGAGLFDEMGLGKTVQALIAAPKGAPILVVAPAAVKGVWVKESRRWRPDLGFPRVLSGRNSFRWPAAGELVITNYDVLIEPENISDNPDHPRYALPSWLPAPKDGTVLIVDECHMIKSPKARRTIAARLISGAVKKANGFCWGLTGTPMLNRPPELWHVLRVLGVAEEAFDSWRAFGQMFRDVAQRNDNGMVTGWTKEPRPEVAQRLRAVSLMRRRAEVLPDLPTKTYQEVMVEIDSDTRALADKIVTKLAAAGLSLENVTDIAQIVAATKTARLSIGEISAVRAALAKAKTGRMIELIQEYEAQDKPVVVFSAHRGPVDLAAQREGWLRITGDEEGLSRSGIVATFAEGNAKGIACTIRAAGVGIDGLQRASHEVIFVDLDWTPGMNQQAEDRVCRIGQDRGVIITTMIADHILDQKVISLLAAKTRVIDASVNASARAVVEEQFPDRPAELLPEVKVRTQAEATQKATEALVTLPNLWAAFAAVKATGVARATIHLADFEMKMAGKYSKYPGQVLVTNGKPFGDPAGLYYGRLTEGSFYRAPRCTDEVIARLKAWDADINALAREAAAYGHNTGVCCFCGLDLSDARSVTVGYGPQCAQRFSLPWGSSIDQTVQIPLEGIADGLP